MNCRKFHTGAGEKVEDGVKFLKIKLIREYYTKFRSNRARKFKTVSWLVKRMFKSFTLFYRALTYSLLLIVLFAGLYGCQSLSSFKDDSSKPPQDWLPADNLLLFSHSHNDYEHYPMSGTRFGFNSLEIDLHLKDGVLYVAHDEEDIRKDYTLKAMYLDMLQNRLASRGNSNWFYEEKEPLILLMDIKSDSITTYEALIEELETVQKYLTTFTNQEIQYRALLIVISGNRPKNRMLQDSLRYAAYDGRLSDLNKSFPPNFLYWISDNWEEHFSWRGKDRFLSIERKRLELYVERVHEKGAQLRFWKIPDLNRPVRERSS